MDIHGNPTRADIVRFSLACEAIGAPVPSAIAKALHLLAVADAHTTTPTAPLLAMTDSAAQKQITEYSIREHEGASGNSRGMRPGLDRFETELLAEVRSAIMVDIEQMVDDLRPAFDDAATPLVTAAALGLRADTTSDQVILAADESLATAWRGARAAIAKVTRLANLRILMSCVLGLSPTLNEARARTGIPTLPLERVSHTVCFAAGENWGFDGAYHVDGNVARGIDWLSLAAGGLRLNSPDDVRAKYATRPGAPVVDDDLDDLDTVDSVLGPNYPVP